MTPMLGANLGAIRHISLHTVIDAPGPVHGDHRAHRADQAHLIRQKPVDSNADSNAADRASTCATFEPCWAALSGRQRTPRPDLVIRRFLGRLNAHERRLGPHLRMKLGGSLAYVGDELAPTPAAPVLGERIGDGLNPLTMR